jgi:DNA-binding response OmpR family regulator
MPTDTILIIDKDHTFSSTARQTFEETGLFDISIAATGMEALAASSTRDINLVLMESEPADMSAQTLIEKLRARQPDLPIIAMHTAQSTSEISIEDLKVQSTLFKPIHFLDLPGIVADFMGKSETAISTDLFNPESVHAAVIDVAQSQTTSRSPGMESAREELVNLVHESQAFSCLLIQGGEVNTIVGQLSTSQIQLSFPFLEELARSRDASLPLAKFYPLAAMDIGITLFIHAVAPNIRIVSLFDDQIEFGAARAQAEEIAHTFSISVAPSESAEKATVGDAGFDQLTDLDHIDESYLDIL